MAKFDAPLVTSDQTFRFKLTVSDGKADDVANVSILVRGSDVSINDEVNIGLIAPLTGDLESIGAQIKQASILGLKHFNEYLMGEDTSAGWYLNMTIRDSYANKTIALAEIEDLHDNHGIKVVLGPATSENVNHTKPFADKNNMLLVSCCSTAHSLAIPGDSLYRLAPDDNNQGMAIAKLMEDQGIDVMIPVFRNDIWGSGLNASSTKFFVALGGKADSGIIYDPDSEDSPNATSSLLSEKIQKYIVEYGADKVAVLFIGFSEVVDFMTSASKYDNLNGVRWFGADAIARDDKLIKNLMAREFSEMTQFMTVQFAASADTEKYDIVRNYFIKESGMAPSSYAYSSYDAVWLVGLSMLDTNSTDITNIKRVLSDIAENYTGAIGNTALNTAGDLKHANYEISGIRDDKWTRLGLYNYTDESIHFFNPTANAGDDQTVDEGTKKVTLDGTGSTDPDGDTLTYAWSQIQGPTVTLSSSTLVSPTFDAPTVTSDQTLTFSLTVNDGAIDSTNDARVTVTILDTDAVTPSPGGGSSGGGGGGGGGPIRIDNVYIKSVSWDCNAGTIKIIAGPDSDYLSISVRTTQLGVHQASMAGDDIPGYRAFVSNMDKTEDYIGIKAVALHGRDSTIISESINITECTGERTFDEYMQPESTLPSAVTQTEEERAATQRTEDTPVTEGQETIFDSPLHQQLKGDIPAEMVQCNEGLVLILKPNMEESACVKESTAHKLVMRGWHGMS